MNVRMWMAAAVAAVTVTAGAALWAWAPWSSAPEAEWLDVNESMAALLTEDDVLSEPAVVSKNVPKETDAKVEAEAEVTSEPKPEPEPEPGPSLVDINAAGVDELDSLPGIGAKKAAAIIAYREEHGPFRTIEEIMNVKGIGDKMFAKMKDRLSAGK